MLFSISINLTHSPGSLILVLSWAIAVLPAAWLGLRLLICRIPKQRGFARFCKSAQAQGESCRQGMAGSFQHPKCFSGASSFGGYWPPPFLAVWQVSGRDSEVSDSSLKPRSSVLTDGAHRAPARAMLRAAGIKDEDFTKPLIGIANTWIEIGPCNYHLRELAVHVRDGIRAAGGPPLEFNPVSISDGITMGTEGMRASLISREVIADSIELVTRGNLLDALIVLVGCDKTIPGGAMALARLNIPGLILYGGSLAPR